MTRDAPTDDAVDAAIDRLRDELLDSMNTSYDDAVLLIARGVDGHDAATGARLCDLDRHGITIDVANRDGTDRRRVDFAEPVTDPLRTTRALYDLVRDARSRTGAPGTTSFERAMAAPVTFRTHLAAVTEVADIHPHLRRITFAGVDLATLDPPGPDAFCYVLLPPAGRDRLTVGRDFRWEDIARMAPEDRPRGAYYTVRAWRPETGEVDMDFVLHGDGHADVHDATASCWARTARPGDPAALWGPRTSWDPPAGTDRYLLVADETGLPATACIVDSLPKGTPVTVVAEVATLDERPALSERPSVEVIWCARDGAPPGTTDLLVEHVRAAHRPDGDVYVWGGGESHAMTAVRKLVRHDWGLDRAAVSLVAYWRYEPVPDR